MHVPFWVEVSILKVVVGGEEGGGVLLQWNHQFRGDKVPLVVVIDT